MENFFRKNIPPIYTIWKIHVNSFSRCFWRMTIPKSYVVVSATHMATFHQDSFLGGSGQEVFRERTSRKNREKLNKIYSINSEEAT